MLPLLRLKMAEVATVVGNVGRALSHVWTGFVSAMAITQQAASVTLTPALQAIKTDFPIWEGAKEISQKSLSTSHSSLPLPYLFYHLVSNQRLKALSHMFCCSQLLMQSEEFACLNSCSGSAFQQQISWQGAGSKYYNEICLLLLLFLYFISKGRIEVCGVGWGRNMKTFIVSLAKHFWF